MTGYTARAYPYPQPADAANGPANIQSLATAVDSDVTASIGPLIVSTYGDLPVVACANIPSSTLTANQVQCVMIKPTVTLTPTKFWWTCVTQSGNVDGAILDGTTGARLWSKGSTACPAPGGITWAIGGGITLNAGSKYYLAFCADNATMAIRAVNLTSTGYSYLYDLSIGIGFKAASFPIPATVAPGTMSVSGLSPFLCLRA